MQEDIFDIELLKKEIENKTRKEKVMEIDSFLRDYQSFCEFTEEAFDEGMEKKVLFLKEQIQNDDSIAYEREWSWYYNTENANVNNIMEARDFIETHRKGEFESLHFFNLLFKQKDELKDSIDMPLEFIERLKRLPLNEIQMHILLCMILYWRGGYPVNEDERKYQVIYKLVEREFLAMYPGKLTLEKQFAESYQRRMARMLFPDDSMNKGDLKGFKLSGGKGAKINFIRVLNALYELKFFTDENGQMPTKQDFMRRVGGFFSIDLSDYDVNISQAFNSGKMEINLEIFEKMKEKTRQIIDSKL